ncbi:MAG: NAD(+) diphosphatase [Cellvibrionaceae bacterium]
MEFNWHSPEELLIEWATSESVPNANLQHWILWKENEICVPSNAKQPTWQLTTDQVSHLSLFGVSVGKIAGKHYFTAALSQEQFDLLSELEACQSVHLRLAGHGNPEWFSILSRGKHLVNWLASHGYCNQCGGGTAISTIEPFMQCTACDARHYPRIAPCIIVLIEKDDHCLLAHNASFPEGYYSAIAGFIEAGESVEECIHREVREEAGIEVENIRYFNSQPWPFPQQLMLGFFADYKSGDVEVDGIELTDAQWYQYDKLPDHPPPFSLSGQLINAFIKKQQN